MPGRPAAPAARARRAPVVRTDARSAGSPAGRPAARTLAARPRRRRDPDGARGLAGGPSGAGAARRGGTIIWKVDYGDNDERGTPRGRGCFMELPAVRKRCLRKAAVRATSNNSKRNHPLEKIEKETTHVIVEMDMGRRRGVGLVWHLTVPRVTRVNSAGAVLLKRPVARRCSRLLPPTAT